ncbi:S-adenosyl-L-methionine-dependent methyltransferase [Penicillium hetheringtonii]|uniref:S-adenosyl-L-methionine-dependent methyltransferase n=1 Tax=Penicillium hetheringtonii TaxID=911720 RepID=A0AAD6DEH4_9EURO|nr:S-adenosyl-L-methionine-dependent methyltransferase [Penicillium hetheringtonii]
MHHQIDNGSFVHEADPNDEREQDRLDLVSLQLSTNSNELLTHESRQSHHIYLMLLKGELHLAPVKNPGRVLDLGTGTGIWALDFAEALTFPSDNPASEVVGIDLSPIQPAWATMTNFDRVPPNCRFEVDDFEEPWTYSHKFDYVHGREMEGSIRDHDQLFQRIYENLNPGGWCEMSSMEVNTYSDDDTHLRASSMLDVAKELHGASRVFGKDMSSISTWKNRMERAGFINVKEVIFKLPQSPWSKDPKLKELGRFHQLNMLEAMPPYCYALFTRTLGWHRIQIEALLAGVRRELKDLSLHLYTKVHFVYGQKPG